ncbi:MAG TPA: hypothetical protein VK633_15635 [Verrucomicrobiae bacterium]|nr:hypothetical protein [Verrucomicrobiae bacterium]
MTHGRARLAHLEGKGSFSYRYNASNKMCVRGGTVQARGKHGLRRDLEGEKWVQGRTATHPLRIKKGKDLLNGAAAISVAPFP